MTSLILCINKFSINQTIGVDKDSTSSCRGNRAAEARRLLDDADQVRYFVFACMYEARVRGREREGGTEGGTEGTLAKASETGSFGGGGRGSGEARVAS